MNHQIAKRLDIVGIIATILYYVRLGNVHSETIFEGGSFDYFRFMGVLINYTGLLGISLLVFTIIVLTSLVYHDILARATGKISKGKFIRNFIWNFIFIPMDVQLLIWVFNR